MRKSLFAFILVGYSAQAAGPIPVGCDRRCLEALVDQTLEAMVAHNPKRVAFAADAHYSENDQTLDLGDGFWQTITARGNYKHYFSDPVTQQAAFFGTMQERGNPLLMGLRLRVQLGRIPELETTYYRQGGGGPADIAGMDKLGKPEGLWLEPPPGPKVSRNQLIATANAYFAGLENNDGKGDNPFADDCDRIENGYHTTNRARNPKLTDGRKVSMKGFTRPSSIEVTEAFRIEGGKIRRVEMVGSSVPYHLNPAWPGGLSDK